MHYHPNIVLFFYFLFFLIFSAIFCEMSLQNIQISMSFFFLLYKHQYLQNSFLLLLLFISYYKKKTKLFCGLLRFRTILEFRLCRLDDLNPFMILFTSKGAWFSVKAFLFFLARLTFAFKSLDIEEKSKYSTC